jgi:hypothetical protein
VRALLSRAAVLIAALSIFPCAAARPEVPAPTPWLAISDVHYDPANKHHRPSRLGSDTNDALLTSMLAEAHAVDPNPPVVLIGGDFLAHSFKRADANATMEELARRFDATFPNAQFVIALGNNDSNCGDYNAPIDGPFLSAVAKAWAPLVNRRGAAPDFAARFAHDGSYVARLPEPGLRVVVTNDVFDALRYNSSCAKGIDGAAESLGRFQHDLRDAGPGDHNWTLFHVPPGIDAFSTTHLTHHLGVVPFLRPHAREALESDIGDPRNRVILAIAGHTHKFAYRIVPGPGDVRVPTLLVPSVSPVFDNGPSFLEIGVQPDGSLSTVVEYSYAHRAWHRLGDLAELGVAHFTPSELDALQQRLAREPALRAEFSRLYSGAGNPEIDESNWRSYWCAVANFSATDFDDCTGQSGFGILTRRGVEVVVVLAVLVVALSAFFFFRGRRRPAAVR